MHFKSYKWFQIDTSICWGTWLRKYRMPDPQKTKSKLKSLLKNMMIPLRSISPYLWHKSKSTGIWKTMRWWEKCWYNLLNIVVNTKFGKSTWRMCSSCKKSIQKLLSITSQLLNSMKKTFYLSARLYWQIFVSHILWLHRTLKQKNWWKYLKRRKREWQMKSQRSLYIIYALWTW